MFLSSKFGLYLQIYRPILYGILFFLVNLSPYLLLDMFDELQKRVCRVYSLLIATSLEQLAVYRHLTGF